MAEIETAEVEEEVVVEQEEVEAEVVEKEETKPEETEEVIKDDEFVVSIGEETPPQEETEAAPEWVKDLRKKSREDAKKIKDLESRLEATEKKPETVKLGEKPKLSDPGIDFDEDNLSTAMDGWYETKNLVEQQEASKKEVEETQQKAWNNTLQSYEKKKTSLKTKVKDFDDAEALVKESLSPLYQGTILQGSKDPALLMLALGRNPQKLKELSSIKNAAEFIWAVATMESQLKTGNRKAATKPEGKIEGSGAGGAIDNTLEKLRAKAEKSGDFTEVTKYKRDKRKKG